MCRVMGVFSGRSTSAFAPLVETDKSLWRQSTAQPRQRQEDGWGLAWFRGDKGPRVFKSSGSLPREKKRWTDAARRAQGKIILSHIRRASNPRGLPLSRLRGKNNAQPFLDGRWVFVHNGSIPFPDDAARFLGAWRKKVRGLNDSEVLFWLIRKEMDRSGSVRRALSRVRTILREVHRRSIRKNPEGAASFHGGINILLSDGVRLWAYAETPPSPRAGRTKSLCSPEWPYYRMAFLPEADRVIVASEPLWRGARWRALNSGELLEVGFSKHAGVAWKKSKIIPGGS
jgi:predicted glutamine amidotransferase